MTDEESDRGHKWGTLLKKVPLTHERLLQVLDYDPETGVFTCRIARSSAKAGARAGTLALGRWLINIDGRRYRANRLAWFYVHGEWPQLEIDHIDRNPSNDRIANLRLATRSQNMANRPAQINSVSGLKGVSFHKRSGLFYGRITHQGRTHSVGYFKTPEEVSAAYAIKAKELFGEFARI